MHSRERPYRRPIGYFQAKAALVKIDRYYELIKIDNFTTLHDQDERKRLQKKYPELFQRKGMVVNYQATGGEIRKLTASVYHALARINAPIDWRSTKEDLEYDFEKHRNVKKSKTEHYNVILDRNYPAFRGKKGFQDIEVTYPMLEESRAVYESIAKNYWKRLINPLWWIASILRLPISLLEYMGVDTETEDINKLVYWLLQILVLLILSFLGIKLGLEVKWPTF